MAVPRVGASAVGESDCIVTDANAAAVRNLGQWSRGPGRASLLTGPPKSGRSHLGRIFQHWSSGDVIDDADLADEQMIFHAWNRAQELRRPLLIIASAAPPLWQIALPDLASRLKATPSEIGRAQRLNSSH